MVFSFTSRGWQGVAYLSCFSCTERAYMIHAGGFYVKADWRIFSSLTDLCRDCMLKPTKLRQNVNSQLMTGTWTRIRQIIWLKSNQLKRKRKLCLLSNACQVESTTTLCVTMWAPSASLKPSRKHGHWGRTIWPRFRMPLQWKRRKILTVVGATSSIREGPNCKDDSLVNRNIHVVSPKQPTMHYVLFHLLYEVYMGRNTFLLTLNINICCLNEFLHFTVKHC